MNILADTAQVGGGGVHDKTITVRTEVEEAPQLSAGWKTSQSPSVTTSEELSGLRTEQLRDFYISGPCVYASALRPWVFTDFNNIRWSLEARPAVLKASHTKQLLFICSSVFCT